MDIYKYLVMIKEEDSSIYNELWIKLAIQNNTFMILLEYDFKLVENNSMQSLLTNKFEYYKEISKIVSVKTEEGNSLLTDEYEKINFISNETA